MALVLVIPMRAGRDPYGFIGPSQGIPIKADPDIPELARRVFDLTIEKKQSSLTMARALVSRFERTASFDAGRLNLEYLRRIPAETWTLTLKERARQAMRENKQLKKLLVDSRPAYVALERILEPQTV